MGHIEIGALFESVRMNRELDGEAQSHLKECDECRERVHWMGTAAALGPQELEFEPPKELLDRVLRIGRAPDYLKKLRNFITATLTFDSLRDLAPAGVRRTESASRELTYEAQDLDIAVSLRRSENGKLTLMGQILTKSNSPLGGAAAHVDLVRDGEHVASTPLSQWGEFVFENLPDSRYTLQAYIGDRVIQIIG